MAFCFYPKGVPPNGWMGSYPSAGPLKQPPCKLSNVELDVGGGREVSVKEAYSGAGVFITGATGYVGSVVVEQLLRLVPDLKEIYILIRPKRGKTGEARLDELLSKKLFDLLRGPDGKLLPELRAKLIAVEGDVDGENCSMKPEDVKRVQEGTNYIVHCAASISFFEHVHVLLTQNYQATKKLMKLAHTIPGMKGFIHVSTAYVNCNLPKGSHIEEKIYPLILKDGTKLDHAKVAEELLALNSTQATKRAAYYINDLGFPNAYTLSKHMAEDLVTDLHLRPFPVSIVRPSIIGCLAYSPVPGYFGNAAGLTNMILAFASGMARFSCHDPNHVWDLIPCDMVGSLILAAGAALYKGAYHEDRPLVLHACSSVSNGERYGDLFCADIFTYWSNDQPKRRFTPGPYKPVEHWTAFLPETTLTFKLLTLKHTIKYRILSAMVRTKSKALADRMWTGWKVYKLYNTSRLDFNVFYCSNVAGELQKQLPADESKDLKLRWVRGEDDWHKYLFIHQETVREKYFNDKVLGIKTKPKKGADQPSTPSSARKSGLKKSESMAKLEDPSAAEELGQDAVSMAVMAHKRLSEEEEPKPAPVAV